MNFAKANIVKNSIINIETKLEQGLFEPLYVLTSNQYDTHIEIDGIYSSHDKAKKAMIRRAINSAICCIMDTLYKENEVSEDSLFQFANAYIQCNAWSIICMTHLDPSKSIYQIFPSNLYCMDKLAFYLTQSVEDLKQSQPHFAWNEKSIKSHALTIDADIELSKLNVDYS